MRVSAQAARTSFALNSIGVCRSNSATATCGTLTSNACAPFARPARESGRPCSRAQWAAGTGCNQLLRPSSGRPATVTAGAVSAALFAAVTASASQASVGSAAAAAAAAGGLPPTLVAVVSLLPSLGTFVLCVAGAVVLLLGCLPALWAMARAAVRAERLMAAAEAELPDTIAAMRLSGLELTDCIQELGALGGELTRGVRSTAALATMAEAGVRGGVAAADAAVRTQLLPAAAKVEGQARGAVETRLAANSQLTYTKPLVSQAITATTKAARRLRTGLAVGQLAGAAVQAGRAARDAFEQRAAQEEQQEEADAAARRATALQAAAQDAARLEESERALREQLEALKAKQRQQQQSTRG
ncbi:hypothetical protein HYH02_006003 [Chlamydomonas schloesseri]|uniref:Uncharacterized protein n=2 Tax=Chlamydomonas schloesseri TaxID=2026947 RepID=A0A836B6Y1_9CHLO|nr:hypothetical protein HYH02_006003 [Chlamydomonas schloesseri]|eukprot:KAG2449258.1 hypothetical protein HYH02_006003 [Chlamydomonas schloesseri]